MRESVISAYQKIVLDRAGLTIVVLLAVALAVLSQVTHFEVDASPDRLILESDEDWKYYRSLMNRFPQGPVRASFVLVSTPEGVFTESAVQRIENLITDIRQLDGVKEVISVLDLPLLNDPELSIANFTEKARSIADGASDLKLAQEEFLTNPFYKDLFLSPDGKSTNIFVSHHINQQEIDLVNERQALRDKARDGEISEQEQQRMDAIQTEVSALYIKLQEENGTRVQDLRGVLDKHKAQDSILLSGLSMVLADIITSIKSDLGVFALGILAFLALTLAVIFRRVQWVLLPLSCCIAACLIMFGYLGWARFPVTVVSANFPAILIIITMSMIIHLVVVYREASAHHPELDQRALVALTTRSMFLPCFYTVLTTIVAFTSLVFSDIRPVIDFGLMMTAGLCVSFLIAFLLFPAVLMLMKRSADSAEVDTEGKPLTEYFADFTHKFGPVLLVICGLLAVMAVTGVNRLSVENRFVDYFKDSTAINQGLVKLDQDFMGTVPVEVVLTGNNIDPAQAWADYQNALENPVAVVDDEDCFLDDECDEDVFGQQSMLTLSGVKRIEAVDSYLQSLPETGKVLSILTTIQVAQKIKGSPLDTLELAIMGRIIPEDLRELMFKTFLNETTQEARFMAFLRDSDPNLKRDDFLKKMRKGLIEEVGLKEDEFKITGLLVLYNNMLQSLFDSQIKTLGFVFGCIMIMFLILFRSLAVSFIAITPNILAAGIVLGTMGWANIALNLMTVTIAAISVGIAVDDTIHYIYRFKEEFKKDRNYIQTMYRSHRSIGKAMYYTSLTIILGFSILVVSDFKPYILFGVFTGLAMAIALLGSLTLLPKLILMVKPFGPEGFSESGTPLPDSALNVADTRGTEKV